MSIINSAKFVKKYENDKERMEKATHFHDSAMPSGVLGVVILQKYSFDWLSTRSVFFQPTNEARAEAGLVHHLPTFFLCGCFVVYGLLELSDFLKKYILLCLPEVYQLP